MELFMLLSLMCLGAAADLQCSLVPGKLKQLDAGNGEVYGVNSEENIYHLTKTGWVQVQGKLTHITVGPGGLWGVNRDNLIYRMKDNFWVETNGQMKQIDAGGDKYLAGVSKQEAIFCLNEDATVSGATDLAYRQLDGSMQYCSCGLYGCWCVNRKNEIYFRFGVTKSNCAGSGWKQVEGKLVMLEVSTDGAVYGVNMMGNIYKREAITAKTPIGTSWTLLPISGPFTHVTYDIGNLWLLNREGDIFKCTVNTGSKDSNVYHSPKQVCLTIN
ncbi:fish-egg lectin-like [Pelodytes ibericus]